MTTRQDVITSFVAVPQRVAEVQEPSTEFTAQDVVDTLRVQESSFTGMSHPSLLDAFGKQDLGGGVAVGITVALRDTKIAFQGRTTPAELGTVTSVVSSPLVNTQQFIDTSSDFVASEVSRGSLMINFTDRSIAEVTDIVQTDEIRTKTLVNGLTNTYTIGDYYQVFNVTQCSAIGGNIVALDEDGVTPISQILPTAFTQVVTTASSSATLSEQQDIQFSSYLGYVSIDLNSPYSGTKFPVGTPRQPVNNQIDAIAIAREVGLTAFSLCSSITIDIGPDFSNITWYGESQTKTTITIPAGATITNCEFEQSRVIGTLDGVSAARDCTLKDTLDMNGEFVRCGLVGDLTCYSGGVVEFINCWSEVPGIATPVIDVGTASFLMRNYSGGVEFTNKTGTEGFSADLLSGQTIVDDSCTSGTMIIRGLGTWSNQSVYAGTATVVSELVESQDVMLTRALMEADQVFDQGAGLLHYYRRGTTIDLIAPKTVVTTQTQDTSLVE